ncbi:hypothetical protein QCA50_020773 [Cerrena zonata]|uniref:DUF6532 domain-containing protein n=1 Tax=Cerrena zonata TaxID=2478898 RepID=A0AAW0FGA7_9APHY
MPPRTASYEQLSRAQKSARTRAFNRQTQEQDDQALIESTQGSPGPRAPKPRTRTLEDDAWHASQRKHGRDEEPIAENPPEPGHATAATTNLKSADKRQTRSQSQAVPAGTLSPRKTSAPQKKQKTMQPVPSETVQVTTQLQQSDVRTQNQKNKQSSRLILPRDDRDSDPDDDPPNGTQHSQTRVLGSSQRKPTMTVQEAVNFEETDPLPDRVTRPAGTQAIYGKKTRLSQHQPPPTPPQCDDDDVHLQAGDTIDVDDGRTSQHQPDIEMDDDHRSTKGKGIVRGNVYDTDGEDEDEDEDEDVKQGVGEDIWGQDVEYEDEEDEEVTTEALRKERAQLLSSDDRYAGQNEDYRFEEDRRYPDGLQFEENNRYVDEDSDVDGIDDMPQPHVNKVINVIWDDDDNGNPPPSKLKTSKPAVTKKSDISKSTQSQTMRTMQPTVSPPKQKQKRIAAAGVPSAKVSSPTLKAVAQPTRKKAAPPKTAALPKKAAPPKKKKKTAAPHKRVEQRQAERAVVVDDDDDDDPADSDHAAEDSGLVGDQFWPKAVHLKLSIHNHVNVNSQRPRIKVILKRLNKLITYDAFIYDAFPEYPYKINYLRECCEAAAGDDDEVTERIAKDEEYFLLLKTVPENRLISIRGKIKSHLRSLVAATYGLTPGCSVLVRAWRKGRRYIYPGATPGTIDSSAPYQNPCIIQGLSSAFFSGPTSFVQLHFSIFKVDRSANDKDKTTLEVTRSMVGLVATAIESILCDWETGTYDHTALISNTANIVYKGHIIFLKEIKTKKPKSYHFMLSTLFYMASNGHVFTAATAAAAECMQVLNLNDMPEDSGPSEDENEEAFY